LPVRLRRVASGLIIENVLSTTIMRPLFNKHGLLLHSLF